jgi:alpha-L-fucosidase
MSKQIKIGRAIIIFVLAFLTLNTATAQEPFGPVPSKRQLEWHKMEMYAFVHFSINTFTDIEWGYGDNDPKLFNPSELDCRQWARVCKENGLKGIIITAKHHDGFCLWPSKFTDYSVKNSSWKNGQGDLLRELVDACKEYDLKLGIYLSPWDCNHAEYGKPEYITYFRNQLRELLTNYGEIFEVWFDGANGGDGYYGGARETRNVDRKTYYRWPEVYEIVRELQPNAMLFSDAGPDCRWAGNESGWIGETNWSLLKRDEYYPGCDCAKQLQVGDEDGTHWVPAEVDVSIRPGWFYHESEDHKLRSLPEMVDIYYNSIGRGSSLLINFPVDKRGLIHENDVQRLEEWSAVIQSDLKNNLAEGIKATASSIEKNYVASNTVDSNPETFWLPAHNITSATLEFEFDTETEFNRFLVQEYITLGQRVQEFEIEIRKNGKWESISKGTTIGSKRILRFPNVKTKQIRLVIKKSKARPVISNVEIYKAPKLLTLPVISREKSGLTSIEVADNGLDIYYSLDGSVPTSNSNKYSKPFMLTHPTTVKSVAFDKLSGNKSPVATVRFDISKDKWSVVNSSAPKAIFAIDGDENTTWRSEKINNEIIVDLGRVESLIGFSYVPDQSRWAAGIISHYEFYLSADGKNWGDPVSKGEFSNIKNNPVKQNKSFEGTTGRFIKLKATRIVGGGETVGIGELDIITN